MTNDGSFFFLLSLSMAQYTNTHSALSNFQIYYTDIIGIEIILLLR